MILFRDTDDKIIEQSNWIRDPIGSYTQLKVVVSDATFTWWLTPSKKKTKISLDSLQKTNKTHNWPHVTKIRSLRSCLPLIIISMQKNLRDPLILPRGIDDQIIKKSD